MENMCVIEDASRSLSGTFFWVTSTTESTPRTPKAENWGQTRVKRKSKSSKINAEQRARSRFLCGVRNKKAVQKQQQPIDVKPTFFAALNAYSVLGSQNDLKFLRRCQMGSK